ncbi:DciA family protein [Candidatus Margulisiibacteriota bacterium]
MRQLKPILSKTKNKNIKRAEQYLRLFHIWNTSFSSNLTNNCQPIKIYGPVLVLATSSPVWTHKLFGSKQEIIKQLKDLKMSVKEIQFSVSTPAGIRKIKEQFQEENDVPGIVEPEAGSIQIKTLKQVTASIIDKAGKIKEKRSKDGWKICPNCGRLYNGLSSNCLLCDTDIEKEKTAQVVKLLQEVPWTRYEDNQLKNVVDNKTFIRIKENLLSNLKDQLYYIAFCNDKAGKARTRKIVCDYISLRTGMSPREMTDVLIRKTLGKKLADALLGPVKKEYIGVKK